jgi:multimeric flavodoxin WrbA
MKSFIVNEYPVPIPEGAASFDLSNRELKHCIGCFSCWLQTPGRCVHRDLDEFYKGYLGADHVTFYVDVSQGFVTSNMKALIDRMIPFVLPYISWKTGESLHVPRYTCYPSVEILYRGEFLPGEEEAFIAYWNRSMYMMFAPEITLRRLEGIPTVS